MEQRLCKKFFKIVKFTLIELLTVIVIMTIVMGMSAAVVASLQTNKGPEGAQRTVFRLIELSRQAAIQQNRMVALLFATKSASGYFSDANMQQQLSGMPSNAAGIYLRPCLIDRENNFVSYFRDTQWEMLPTRSVFELDLSAGWEEISFPSGDGDVLNANAKIRALVFQPNGSLRTTAEPKVNVYPLNSKHFNPSNKIRFYYEIKVNWLTGRATVTRKEEP